MDNPIFEIIKYLMNNNINRAEQIDQKQIKNLLSLVPDLPEKEIFSIAKKHLKPFITINGLIASNCSYCKRPFATQKMFYVTTDSLSPADYQKFADAGFVRSGNLLYLVCPSSSCCPAYPMRLDVRDFKASRSQRKVLNRFGKYTNPTKTSENSHIRKTDFRKLNQILSKENGIYPQIRKFVVAKLEFLNCYEGFEDFVVGDENWDLKVHSRKSNCIITNLPIKLYKYLEKFDRFNQNFAQFSEKLCKILSGKFLIASKTKNQSVLLLQILKENRDFKTFSASNNFKASKKKNYSKFSKKFSFELLPAKYSDDIFEVFLCYETKIHKRDKKEIDESRFEKFLCTSPIKNQSIVGSKAPEKCEGKFGSYFAILRIENEIVYVNVVDILPKEIKSVYLFYNPKYSFLSPGTLSALKDIELIENEMKQNEDFKFYSMGLYIHSCPKMRYKENFGPAKILKSSSFEYSIKQEWLNLAEQKKFFSDQNNQKEIRESIFFKSIEINYDFLYKDGKDIFVLTKNRFCSISEHFKAEKDNWKFSFAKGIFAAWLSVCCGLFGVDFMKKFIWFHDDSSE